MRPTRLPTTVDPEVEGGEPVAAQDPGKGAHDLLRGLGSAARMDHEEGYERGDERPEEGLLVLLGPARVVDVGDVLAAGEVLRFLDGRGERLADGPLGRAYGAKGHVDAEDVAEELLGLPLRQPVDAG